MTPVEALQSIVPLLRSSESSLWAPEDPLEIADFIEAVVAALQSGRDFDRDRLRLFFLPIGSIQEIAIRNGWSDQYLEVSAVVDTITQK
jgi:hypothetical protein